MKAYVYRGKKIFVAELTKAGTYGTVWQGELGGVQRLRYGSHLPLHDTLEEAQRDLDEFARVRKLKEAE